MIAVALENGLPGPSRIDPHANRKVEAKVQNGVYLAGTVVGPRQSGTAS